MHLKIFKNNVINIFKKWVNIAFSGIYFWIFYYIIIFIDKQFWIPTPARSRNLLLLNFLINSLSINNKIIKKQPTWIKRLELQPKTIFNLWPLHSFVPFLARFASKHDNTKCLPIIRSSIWSDPSRAAGLKILHTNRKRKESHCIENSISFINMYFINRDYLARAATPTHKRTSTKNSDGEQTNPLNLDGRYKKKSRYKAISMACQY